MADDQPTEAAQGTAHEEWEELAALAALAPLPPQEAARLGEHITACPACRARLAEYGLVADQIARSVPLVTAPATSEQRLRRALAGERAPQPRLRSLRPWRSWGLAAAALVAALLLGMHNLQLRSELAQRPSNGPVIAAVNAPNARPVPLVAAPSVPAGGRFVWAPGQPDASLGIAGLPPSAQGQTYQIWFVTKDGRVLAGDTFTIGPDGVARLAVRCPVPWSDLDSLFITVEPASGSPQPTGPSLIEGRFAT
jgi:anti-sigma factor RsiW